MQTRTDIEKLGHHDFKKRNPILVMLGGSARPFVSLHVIEAWHTICFPARKRRNFWGFASTSALEASGSFPKCSTQISCIRTSRLLHCPSWGSCLLSSANSALVFALGSESPRKALSAHFSSCEIKLLERELRKLDRNSK